MKDMIVFAFGRCNPPTAGHAKMVKAVMTVAKRNLADHAVWVSASQDPKKNPLDATTKAKFLGKMVKGANIVPAGGNTRTFIEVAKSYSGKYKKLVMVAGSDRIDEYRTLLNKYNGKEYTFEEIAVVSAGERDPDAEGVTGISGTKMREFAKANDLNSFKSGTLNLSDKDAKEMLDAVRKGMKLESYRSLLNYIQEQGTTVFNPNYTDPIVEAAKKALHPNQKSLDADKDGDIEADDLKDLRAKKVDEADPCWKGYKQVGMKDKDGKQVPNCVPESADQVDELSKSTLGSYIKKASLDSVSKGVSAGGQMATGQNDKGFDNTKKALKRTSGIAKATDKLTKEETDQVEERVTGGYSKSYSNPYYAEQKAKMRKLDAARKAREKAAKEAKSSEPVKEGSNEPESTKDKTHAKLPAPTRGGALQGEIPKGFKAPKDTGFYGMNSKSIKDVRGESVIEKLKKSKAVFEELYGNKNIVDVIEEASDTYFPTFSAAVQHAYDATEKKGYTVDSDDWQNKVSTGPKKPSVGKTNSYNINLMKNGKESKQKLHIQVYGMEGGKYELNFYVS